METMQEQRSESRHEPKFLSVSFTNSVGEKIKGAILDVSQSGIAIELFDEACLRGLEVGSAVSDLEITKGDKTISVRDGTIRRVWNDDTYFSKNYGVAIRLSKRLSELNADGFVLKGLMKTRRINAQQEIARHDLNYLNDYRRYLGECQLKLLELALVTSVSVAAIYFGIAYSGFILNNKADPSVSFWRTLIAALPGFISVSCAMLVSQKSMSIQRVETFMNILKECILNNNFPREYRGWESESKKIRQVYMTERCKECSRSKKTQCGTLGAEETTILRSKRLFKNPKLDFYNTLIYIVFYTISILSSVAVLYELFRYHRDTVRYAVASSLITLAIVGTLGYVGYLLYQVRKGKYSTVVLKRIWIDVMTHCAKQN